MAKIKRITKPREYHGLSRHPLYPVWCTLRARCYNPKHDAYAYYGGRGVKVCDRWRTSFAMFLADVGERPGPDYSLDRLDGNGDYEPTNVKWATRASQMRNSRQARLTLEDVQRIRWLYHIQGLTYQVIADQFDIAKTNVGRIIRGETWKD